MTSDVRFTLGAVLGGSFLSTALFGSLCLQTFLYVKQYPNDSKRIKALVALVWQVIPMYDSDSNQLVYRVMDTIQTCCIVSLSYQYMILNFAKPQIVDHIFNTVAVSILLTALLTLTVNGFFAHKVHKLSRGNWWLTGPTVFCMISRLGLGAVTVIEMLLLRSYRLYFLRFAPVLTTALALSAITDLIITGGLCYYLRALNPELYQSKRMLSTIVSFADNNGALTCVVAISSLICWVVVPKDLIYLGLHFTIGKCYSNSLLAALNMRDYVKRTAETAVDVPKRPKGLSQSASYPMTRRAGDSWPELDCYDEERTNDERMEGGLALKVRVDKMVHCD
ncbi:hypothetical protein BJV74DRAFT_985582 [Russula compacta]|nr:hypothetical protein BJV74DRAFT_985582 [Russula compacta]